MRVRRGVTVGSSDVALRCLGWGTSASNGWAGREVRAYLWAIGRRRQSFVIVGVVVAVEGRDQYLTMLIAGDRDLPSVPHPALQRLLHTNRGEDGCSEAVEHR